MKKLFITFGIIWGFVINSHAGLITHTDYSDGATITAAGQNNNENTIFNEFNGNIDDSNIKSGAAISLSKLTALAAQTMVFTNSTGFLTTSTTTLSGPIVVSTGITVSGPIVSSGTISFTNTDQQGIVGATNGVLGTVGMVGEVKFSSGNSVNFPTSTHATDVGFITLTAGDWEISGQMFYNEAGAANLQSLACGIGTTTGDSSNGLTDGDNFSKWNNITPPGGTGIYSCVVPAWPVRITSTTTYYWKAIVTYTGAAGNLKGRINARRLR